MQIDACLTMAYARIGAYRRKYIVRLRFPASSVAAAEAISK
jgi:hypothetical protein